MDVSDLSRLLGDVYGASAPPPADDVEAADATTPTQVPAAADDPPAPPVEQAPADHGAEPVEQADPATASTVAPGWADEQVLDEAFADWIPGPPEDASAEERGMLADVEPAETVAEPIDIDAWLFQDPEATGPTEAPAAVDASETVDESPEEPAMTGPWTRASDDLLPRGRRGRRLQLRR
jgi:hypothetical protein